MEPDRLVRYYGAEGRGVHLPFNFALDPAAVGRGAPSPRGRRVRIGAAAWRVAELGARQPRPVADRDVASGRAGARGGDAAAHAARDADAVLRRRAGPARRPGAAGRGWWTSTAAIPSARRCRGRAPGRSAGFSTRRAVAADGRRRGAWSVEAQREDAGSMLALHRRLLALRRAEPALHAGDWAADRRARGRGGVRAHRRRAPRSGSCSTCSRRPVVVPFDGAWSVALSTHLDREDEPASAASVRLRADEGLVLRASG